MINRLSLLVLICLVALLAAPVVSWAQEEEVAAEATAQDAEGEASSEEESSDTDLESFFASTTVTATGQETDVFGIATPVAVIPAIEIEQKLPENPVDLFRSQPGVDVNGVGPNQARPIIRGQRGLRVLFMENGLRMNNARRQSDFGEVSGLVDMDNVQSLEVVRGPASVLYGTDAIGGVLNLVTKTPAYRDGSWWGFDLGLRYGSAADQGRGNVFLQGRQQKWSYNLGFAYRDSEDYTAPSGTYGDITLDDEADVLNTALQDDSIYGFLGYDLTDSQTLSFRFNRYRAGETGFGLIDPRLLTDPFFSDGIDVVDISYPFQDFDRFNLEYRGLAFESVLANTVNVNLMYQNNERELTNQIDAWANGELFPGFVLDYPLFFHTSVTTENFTDLETLGLRAEVTKILNDKHLLSYGGDYYNDDSFNTDRSVVSGGLSMQMMPGEFPVDIGPPFFTSTDDVANAPNADYLNYGFFVQDQFLIGSRLSGTVGLRYANNETTAKETPGLDTAGLDFSDDAVVGAVNLVFQATANLNLVGTYGTAFRAPNIVERLFNGLTPEGSGYQILNPNLESENSDNFDLGLKYQRRNAIFELVFFRNEIDNGIIQYFLSDEEIDQLPDDVKQKIDESGANFVVQQRNIDKLRVEGFETIIGYRFDNGVSLGANYTNLDEERLDSEQPPTGNTYSDKFNFNIRYDRPSGRFWVEYRVRYNGSADAVTDPDQPVPPVGRVLPSFTVHTLAGGVTLFQTDSMQHLIGIVLDNFTDELYAEFSNASFFRPQPKRNLIVTYRLKM